MADEINQLLSSPKEDPPSPEGSPSDIRLSEVNKTITSTRPGDVAFYEAAFHAIFVFQSILLLGGSCTSITSTLPILFPMHDKVSSTRWLYFKARSKKTLFEGYPNNVKDGRNSSSSRETTSSSPWGYPRTLSSEGSEVVGHPRCSRPTSKSMASSGRDNGEDIPTGWAAPIACDEGESHHFRDDPRQEASRDKVPDILPTKKVKFTANSKGKGTASPPKAKKKFEATPSNTTSKGARVVVAPVEVWQGVERRGDDTTGPGQVELAASRYFGEGFDLCKKQVGHLHPELNIQDLEIDDKLAKEGQEDEEKGDICPISP
ncbi:hypothetical protein Acr_29g0007570 [Actinidia rufa]|uniref:Uncharacterized protein n=1 Tax=Actinidia rufa TaxID=165716 RepID=A0A7J0HF46_9ERIC|nr:hypothetical protein Acr_29g0007570 [Actinidia rufa]